MSEAVDDFVQSMAHVPKDGAINISLSINAARYLVKWGGDWPRWMMLPDGTLNVLGGRIIIREEGDDGN